MKAIIDIDLTKKQKDGTPEIDAFIWAEDREPPPLIRPKRPKEPKDILPARNKDKEENEVRRPGPCGVGGSSFYIDSSDD